MELKTKLSDNLGELKKLKARFLQFFIYFLAKRDKDANQFSINAQRFQKLLQEKEHILSQFESQFNKSNQERESLRIQLMEYQSQLVNLQKSTRQREKTPPFPLPRHPLRNAGVQTEFKQPYPEPTDRLKRDMTDQRMIIEGLKNDSFEKDKIITNLKKEISSHKYNCDRSFSNKSESINKGSSFNTEKISQKDELLYTDDYVLSESHKTTPKDFKEPEAGEKTKEAIFEERLDGYKEHIMELESEIDKWKKVFNAPFFWY